MGRPRFACLRNELQPELVAGRAKSWRKRSNRAPTVSPESRTHGASKPCPPRPSLAPSKPMNRVKWISRVLTRMIARIWRGSRSVSASFRGSSVFGRSGYWCSFFFWLGAASRKQKVNGGGRSGCALWRLPDEAFVNDGCESTNRPDCGAAHPVH